MELIKKLCLLSIILINFTLLSSCTQVSKNPLRDGQYFVYKDAKGNSYKYSVAEEGRNFKVTQEFIGTSAL